jgi:hypothetical protein
VLLTSLALLWLVRAAPGALKPIETDLHPVGNKAVAVYKKTVRATGQLPDAL